MLKRGSEIVRIAAEEGRLKFRDKDQRTSVYFVAIQIVFPP